MLLRLLAMVALIMVAEFSEAAELPNIVIIYADDMGYGDLACQNANAKIPTPNLDQFAREGLRFTDAHSSSGICTPSRYALLTGRYHWRKLYGIVDAFGEPVFDADRLTLPKMLKQRGYDTACIGKWHLGFNWSAIRKSGVSALKKGNKKTWPADSFDWSKPVSGGPLDHGFDYYFGDDVPNFPPYTWIENDRILLAPTTQYAPNPVPAEGNPEGRPGPMAAGWRQDAVMPTLTEKTVAWIEQRANHKAPFFLYWAWTSPHAPIVPASDWKGKTKVGGYGDFLAQSDHHLGDVLQVLEDQGFSENTLLIFSSDNGPERYAFERLREYRHNSSGKLRGVKRDIWEGGHRVPFIVRWPGVVQEATVTDGLMSQIDIMATLAQVVDYTLPSGVAEDSRDQLDLWKGGETSRQTLVHNTNRNRFAIRSNDWVLIDAPSGNHTNKPEWFMKLTGYSESPHPAGLFDLGSDISQHTNLYELHPDRVRMMRELLAETRKQGEVR